MKFDSIRWRLVFSYVLLTVLTVGLVGVLSLTFLQEYIRLQTETRLETNAQAISQQAYRLMNPVPRLDQLQELAQTTSFLGNMRVRILDTRFNVLIDSGMPGETTSVMWVQSDSSGQDQLPVIVPLTPRQWRELQQEQWLRENFEQRPSLVIRIDEGPWGRNVIFEAVPESKAPGTFFPTPLSPAQSENAIQADTRSYGAVRFPIGETDSPMGFVQLDSTQTSGEQVMGAMRRSLLTAGLGAAIIALVAGLAVSRSLTAPVQALAQSATRMSSGDLSARAPEIKGAGEIIRLAQQFNSMAEHLQTSFSALSAERDALRRFIADASHELRTPITALGSFIELLQGPAAQDAAAREEFLNECQVQVKRMDWITSNLLDLSRLDAGLIQLDRKPYNLGDLLQAAAAPFLIRAQERGVRLEVDLPQPPLSIFCDRARMEMALSNLIDNALKFTPAGGQIVLRGEAQNDGVLIQAQDSGSGISAEDLPHVFERFYRGRTSREGSGLGLAIVQSIIQAHGGQVWAESEPGAGSTFNIKL